VVRVLMVAKLEGGGALILAKLEDAGGGGRVSYVEEICLGGGALGVEVGGTTDGPERCGEDGWPLRLNWAGSEGGMFGRVYCGNGEAVLPIGL
jgi:hypothetical protein